MSKIQADHAGLVSGLMTTAHELGASAGVAIFSAVSLGSAATATALAQGYAKGALAGALIAGVLALIAVVAVPTLRPIAASRTTMH